MTTDPIPTTCIRVCIVAVLPAFEAIVLSPDGKIFVSNETATTTHGSGPVRTMNERSTTATGLQFY